MVSLIPYEHFQIKTRLTPEEARYILTVEMQSGQDQAFLHDEHREEEFHLAHPPQTPTTHESLHVTSVSGRFIPTPEGVVIDVRILPHPLLLLAGVILLAFLGMILQKLALPGTTTSLLLIVVGAFFLAHLAWMITFYQEAAQEIYFLKHIFEKGRNF